jgi:putative peptidoglycan lipid II flippase
VTFHSRGDTTTPVIAVAVAIAINVALKFALMGPLGHVGLATATSVGAWVNLSLLVLFARRKDLFTLDERARRVLPKLLASFAVLAATLLGMVFALRTVMGGGLNDKVALAALMATGGIAYGATLILLFGKEFVGDLKRLRRGIGG